MSSGFSISRIPLEGGVTEDVATANADITALSVGEQYVYWAERSSPPKLFSVENSKPHSAAGRFEAAGCSVCGCA